MASPGVASHARLQGFGQVVVLTEFGHGVIASANIRMRRGQTLRRRVEGGSKASARCSLQNVYKRRQSHRPGPLPRPPSLVSNVRSAQYASSTCTVPRCTPPHRSATYQSPCPRRVWCELAGHYSPHRRARGHARRTRRCARVERHRHDIEQQRHRCAYARAPGGAASQRQRACTRSFSGP